jgi:chromosome segregation ATPase
VQLSEARAGASGATRESIKNVGRVRELENELSVSRSDNERLMTRLRQLESDLSQSNIDLDASLQRQRTNENSRLQLEQEILALHAKHRQLVSVSDIFAQKTETLQSQCDNFAARDSAFKSQLENVRILYR